jgi:hypothetical protein
LWLHGETGGLYFGGRIVVGEGISFRERKK